jgi:hypothetical protein
MRRRSLFKCKPRRRHKPNGCKTHIFHHSLFLHSSLFTLHSSNAENKTPLGTRKHQFIAYH